MKIQILNLEGIHIREIKGLEAIKVSFPKEWLAYASLELIREQRGSREFDLVIVTFDRVLAVEIKDWNGKLESDGTSWYLNGESRGKSPVLVIDKKAKILHGQLNRISHKLKDKEHIPVEGLVVLTGKAGKQHLKDVEKKSVFTLSEFLEIAKEVKYRKAFPYIKKYRNLSKNNEVFNHFFLNKRLFKPQEQTFQNHKIVGDPIYVHPNGLYEEYQAQDINVKSNALLRLWNLSTDTLPINQMTQDAKREIIEREPLVLSHIKCVNPELFENRVILEQKAYVSNKIIAEEYAELYDLPINQDRLSQFINKSRLTTNERISLIKFLLSNFSDIHEVNIAHRDLGQDCIWASPTKVSFSGFMSATLPNSKTIRERLPILKSNRILLPEHELDDLHTDPYRQDVFLIGVAAHMIAYGENPILNSGIPDWNEKEGFNQYHPWFQKALSWDPSDRYANASEMLDAFNDVAIVDEDIIDATHLIEFYRVPDVIMVKYLPFEQIKTPPPALIYKSLHDNAPVLVKCWPIQNTHDLMQKLEIYHFFQTIEKFKVIKSNYLSQIVDYGIDQMQNLYMVQKYYEGVSLSQLKVTEDIDHRAKVALKLVEAVETLHKNEIYHRDIRPENIIFTSNNGDIYPILIDIIEYEKRDYCQNYCPPDYEKISLAERDVYATSLVICEILGIEYSISNGIVKIDSSINQLKSICRVLEDMTLPIRIERLPVFGNLIDELKNIIDPPIPEKIPRICIKLTNYELSQDINFDKVYCANKCNPLISENGYYFIKYKSYENKRPDEIFITGINQELKIKYDNASKKILRCWVNYVDFDKVIIASNSNFYIPIKGVIEIELSNNFDVKELEDWIVEDILPIIPTQTDKIEDITENFDELIYTDRNLVEKTIYSPSTSERWKELIEIEETLTLEVNVIGQPIYRNEENLLVIPYNSTNVAPDFNENDKVKVLYKDRRGEDRSIGYLDLSRTNTEFLYVRVVNLPIELQEITKLTLDSLWQNASFKRRSNATKRIIKQQSVISNLLDIFDGRCDDTIYRQELTYDEELIKDYFGENNAQINAFKKILANRPIGLLQGPPGTGKTKFIAAFVHYIFQRLNIKNILLVSQSHEAVNNLGEAIIRLHSEIDPEYNLEMVRVGAEGVISQPLLKFHSVGLRDKYRNTFKAEFKKKVSKIGKDIGLPKRFVSNYFEVQHSLGHIANRLREISDIEDKQAKKIIGQKLNSLTETFFQIYDKKYKDKYGKPEGNPDETLASLESALKEKYNVASYPHYLNKLDKVISLGEEWLKVLDSNTKGFEEFLARTRHIIIGTCVGVGKPSLKIDDNLYEWVIIDEAARCNPSELSVSIQVGKNVLLVGDHKQLPPMIDDFILERTSRKLCIPQKELKKSEFQRLMESDLGKKYGCSLDQQYRMCEPIASMISDIFYKDDGIELKTMREKNIPFFESVPKIIQKQVTWIDTSYGEDESYHKKDMSNSLYNSYEANAIIRLLDIIYSSDKFVKMLEKISSDEAPIGVICPYAAQKRHITQEIAKKAWPTNFSDLIKVDTVDSYQGKENQIIIVSLTRNDRKLTEGFLKYPERINVSLSRARECLVIIGASRMWEVRPIDMPLRQILDYINKRKNTMEYGIFRSENLFKIDGEIKS